MKPKPMTSPMNSCGEWFHRPQSVLDQNCFIAQGNTLYTNTTATRANQLWIHGFVDASSPLLFTRIFCSCVCENSWSHGNSKGRNRMRRSLRVTGQCCSVSSYTTSHKQRHGEHFIPQLFVQNSL